MRRRSNFSASAKNIFPRFLSSITQNPAKSQVQFFLPSHSFSVFSLSCSHFLPNLPIQHGPHTLRVHFPGKKAVRSFFSLCQAYINFCSFSQSLILIILNPLFPSQACSCICLSNRCLDPSHLSSRSHFLSILSAVIVVRRSEERRVGKECRN